MPRGGARPGAGRKSTKPAKVAAKAPATVDAEGFKTDAASPFGMQRPAEPAEPPPKPDLSDLSPLDYLLQVMRDDGEDKARRMQAASLAAPYVHAKKGEGGKKEAKQEAAEKVAGRFRASAPPRLAAAGGKKL